MTTLNWRKPIAERFWSKVRKTDFCWEWTGRKDSYGYGTLGNCDAPPARFRATHISWEMHRVSTVPAGMQVCHTCDNPGCVNPDHLWLGTTQDNTADRDRKGRTNHLPHANPARGERNGSAKISADDVLKIRALWPQSGLSQYEIAALFCISRPTVAGIIHRREWRHI